MNTQNARDELRTLEAAEVDAVSGAAMEVINLGLFGKLTIGTMGGCAGWSNGRDENGQDISFAQCPK